VTSQEEMAGGTRRRSKPSRIAFGSCNDQDRQNNLWPIIESRKPAAFIWGGDSIYAGALKKSKIIDGWCEKDALYES
jgi:hypothetical protein